MPDEKFTDSMEFLSVVCRLRQLAPQYRSLAHYAADFWSSQKFADRVKRAEMAGETYTGVLQ